MRVIGRGWASAEEVEGEGGGLNSIIMVFHSAIIITSMAHIADKGQNGKMAYNENNNINNRYLNMTRSTN